MKSESRYRALAEISPVGMFYTDVQGYTTYVNPQWCQISGMPVEKALGDGWLEAVYPEDRDSLHKGWNEATEHSASSIAEYRFVRPDRSIRWVIGQATPERNADGIIIGYVGTITDITERKVAEEQLKSYNRQLNLSQSIAHVGYWERNLLDGTAYWSDEMFRLFDLEPSEASKDLGLFMQHVHPDDLEQLEQTRRIIIEQGQPLTTEFRYIMKTGEIRYFMTRGYAVTDKNGHPVRMEGITQDITDRAKAQEKTRQTSEQLRQLAAHLQEIREEERAAMAREIHDELGQQLTGLKMDVYWLREEMEAPANGTLEQINGILGLLDQTITTVRKISAALRPPILDDLGLVEALKMYGRDFQQRFSIGVIFSADLPDLSISAKKSIALFRIFQESLTNVARHAEASRIICRLYGHGGNLVLEIADNGKGFDMAAATRKKTLGLLGMQERGLVMEGTCEISSRPGEGTRVLVSVPLETAAAFTEKALP